MLNLEFRDQLVENKFPCNDNRYFKGQGIKVNFFFSINSKELPFFIINTPEVFCSNQLRIEMNNIFNGRGVNMARVKEALNYCSFPLYIRLGEHYFAICKGFMAEVDPGSFIVKKILFCATGSTVNPPQAPEDLKLYMNRVLYEPSMKRIMSLFKDFLSEHKGEIVITNSIEKYLSYKFAAPMLSTIEDRETFQQNMKMLFFRGIKWLGAEEKRKKEEKAAEEQKKAQEAIRASQERLRVFRDSFNNRDRTITSDSIVNTIYGSLDQVGDYTHGSYTVVNIDPINVSDQPPVANLPIIENAEEVALRQYYQNQQMMRDHSETIEQDFERMLDQLPVSEERLGSIQEPNIRIQTSNEESRRLYDVYRQTGNLYTPSSENSDPLLNPITPFSTSMNEALLWGNPREEQPIPDIEPITILDSAQVLTPGAEAISADEIMRIMNQFSINGAPVRYSVSYDAATQLPTNTLLTSSSALSNLPEILSSSFTTIMLECYNSGIRSESDVLHYYSIRALDFLNITYPSGIDIFMVPEFADLNTAAMAVATDIERWYNNLMISDPNPPNIEEEQDSEWIEDEDEDEPEEEIYDGRNPESREDSDHIHVEQAIIDGHIASFTIIDDTESSAE